jgi:hypothetical protein
MATRKRPSPKRVVYLWGAGATQAEAQYLGASISLLMRDTEHFGEGITTRILRRTGRRPTSSFAVGKGVDIEKLISLLAASGIDEHLLLAQHMRANYFAELRSSLTTAKVLDNPRLAIRLLQMHKDRTFQAEVETLSGIITTNHDGLLQVASQDVFGEVNLGFQFTSDDFVELGGGAALPILQLHGSFTWRFGMPIQVGRLRRGSKYADTVWIPPTILKESKNYPFNKLSGLAYELLARHCDVLRVVGASLTQNDWNVLCLIFNAQRHKESTKGAAFLIELIMPHDSGERIKEECAYLKNINSIGYLTEGRFAEYKDTDIPPESDLANPFAYWLSEKTEYHRARHELSGDGADQATAQPVGEHT